MGKLNKLSFGYYTSIYIRKTNRLQIDITPWREKKIIKNYENIFSVDSYLLKKERGDDEKIWC